MLEARTAKVQVRQSAVPLPIELDLHHSDYLVIIGHNGSGKSTLVKDFNVLLRPTGGEVRVKSLDTRDRAPTACQGSSRLLS